jgi:hypothetical protein
MRKSLKQQIGEYIVKNYGIDETKTVLTENGFLVTDENGEFLINQIGTIGQSVEVYEDSVFDITEENPSMKEETTTNVYKNEFIKNLSQTEKDFYSFVDWEYIGISCEELISDVSYESSKKISSIK